MNIKRNSTPEFIWDNVEALTAVELVSDIPPCVGNYGFCSLVCHKCGLNILRIGDHMVGTHTCE